MISIDKIRYWDRKLQNKGNSVSWVKILPSGYYLTLPWKITILVGKPSINGPFSLAMLNNQRVYNDDGDIAEIGQFSDMEHVIPYLAISHIAK